RHTRFSRDWSSDVCSSDLPRRPTRPAGRDAPKALRRSHEVLPRAHGTTTGDTRRGATCTDASPRHTSSSRSPGHQLARTPTTPRSEERRVGKKGRERGTEE